MESFFLDGLFLQVSGLTPGRLTSVIAGLLGLISVIIGLLASTRSTRGLSSGRTMAMAALALALIGIVISVLHLASTTGGFGTGKGRAGAIIALVLGLIGLVFSWRTLTRSRRVASGNSAVPTAGERISKRE